MNDDEPDIFACEICHQLIHRDRLDPDVGRVCYDCNDRREVPMNDNEVYIREHAFYCIECGRHIIRFAAPEDAPDKCGLCITIPGWFRHPDLVKILDHDYDPSEHVTHDPTATRIEPPS